MHTDIKKYALKYTYTEKQGRDEESEGRGEGRNNKRTGGE